MRYKMIPQKTSTFPFSRAFNELLQKYVGLLQNRHDYSYSIYFSFLFILKQDETRIKDKSFLNDFLLVAKDKMKKPGLAKVLLE